MHCRKRTEEQSLELLKLSGEIRITLPVIRFGRCVGRNVGRDGS
jgi:hypothetical protein